MENCEGVTEEMAALDAMRLLWTGIDCRTLATSINRRALQAQGYSTRPVIDRLARIIAEAICDEFGSGEIERAAAAIIMAASLEG